jgi:hypothetical protein
MKTGQQISDERAAIVELRRRANMLEADASALRREAKERSLIELPDRRKGADDMYHIRPR